MLFAIDEGSRMDYDTLRYEQDDHVVTLTYDRPDQHNAINRRMAAELHHAWQRFRDDDGAFVLVITGAGETTFSAGWDLQDASELSELGDWEEFRRSLYSDPGPCGYTRRIDAREAERIGLANEVVPRGRALARAQELAREIAALPQGAIRADKESVVTGVGRTLEERLRIEAEATVSMFMRRDSHTIGAGAFKRREAPDWPHHGL